MRSLSRFCGWSACLLTAGFVYAQTTPPSQSLCDMPSSTPYYAKYCGGGSSSAPAGGAAAGGGLTSQQQLGMGVAQVGGYMIGQGLHDLLVGKPKLTVPLDPATQQRQLAAQQLNNSGLYLLKQRNYAGAINEFQKALAQTPNDPVIRQNLALAQQRQKNTALAAKTSDSLSQVLGRSETSAMSSPAAGSGSAFNLINLDASTVDFRGVGHQTVPYTNTDSGSNPNDSALHAVIHGSDGNTVDLSGAAKTSVDAAALKGQIDDALGRPVSNDVPAPAPAAKDIDSIFSHTDPAAPHN